MKSIPSLISLSLLAACASTRAPLVAPLESTGAVDVHYSSRLSGAAVAPPIDAPSEASPDGSRSGVIVQVACKIFEIDQQVARAMLGDGVRGMLASRDAAESALDRLERDGNTNSLHSPRLTLFDGQLGSLQVLDEHSFVEAFEVTEATDAGSGERTLIGDPVVSTVLEGVQIETRPSVMPDGSTVRLELGLRTSDLLDSVPERETRIPGVGTTVTVQQPLAFTQLVSASADLDPESVLVIGGLPTEKPGRVLVALVAARTAAPAMALAGDR